MSNTRVTYKDCEAALDQLKTAAVAVGFDPERVARWGMSYGSKTYGNTSRLYQVGSDTVTDAERADNIRMHHNNPAYAYGSGHCSTGLPEFLGWGPTDSLNTLHTITATLWAMHDLTKERAGRITATDSVVSA